MPGPTREEFDELSARQDKQENDMVEVKGDISRIRGCVDNIDRSNAGEHKAILEGQNTIHQRIDTFLTNQSTQYVNTVNSLCDHLDKRQDEINGKNIKDVSKMKDVMFGQDENGGLVAKTEGHKRSIIALWTVVGFIIMFLCALLGISIFFGG